MVAHGHIAANPCTFADLMKNTFILLILIAFATVCGSSNTPVPALLTA